MNKDNIKLIERSRGVGVHKLKIRDIKKSLEKSSNPAALLEALLSSLRNQTPAKIEKAAALWAVVRLSVWDKIYFYYNRNGHLFYYSASPIPGRKLPEGHVLHCVLEKPGRGLKHNEFKQFCENLKNFVNLGVCND